MPKPPKVIKTLHYGLGAVGLNIMRAALSHGQLRPVAALDIAPHLSGKSLADLLGMDDSRLKKIRVANALKKSGAQVALHATRSWIKDIAPEIEQLLRARLHVISTAEELVFPVGSNLKIVKRLDALAKKHKVSFIAAGVNPGFVLDYLPLILCQATVRIEHVRARRVVNLAERRLQLQKKVGLGLSLQEFNERCRDPHFGHQGMNESLHLLASGLKFDIKRTHASIRPVLASIDLPWSGGLIGKGDVCGIAQEVMGYVQGKERLRLQVEMILKSENEPGEDTLEISGTPPIHVRIPGGIRGEEATAASIVNLVPRLLAHAKPGFCTLLDVAFPRP